MKLIVVSEDENLCEVCADIVSEGSGTEEFYPVEPWELDYSDPGDLPEGDLYIWDYQQWVDRCYSPKQPSHAWHAVLIERIELESLEPGLQSSPIILVKPVSEALLRLLIRSASQTAASGEIPSPGSERLLGFLSHANILIQERDQGRADFLARALHDFRAPLTALTGYSGLLRTDQLGTVSDEQSAVLLRMENSAKRLARLASGLFQMATESRLDHRPKLMLGDISEPVLQAVHELAPTIKEKRLQLKVTTQESSGHLVFDPFQLAQVMVNLLENACKFTRAEGFIEVTGEPFFWDRRLLRAQSVSSDRRKQQECGPNAYRIDVVNSGAPIPEDQFRTIFEPYAPRPQQPKVQGSGLGLAIANLVMRAHYGKVWVENTPIGPKFSIVLPVRPNYQQVVKHLAEKGSPVAIGQGA